ncbi:OB-fold domain-containing protein [Nocardia sp. CA2R105]|uniref:Zn-ribbon domain-containing OB-fold protein n=1 Tax=Nocardia coffeae TaxID=2873381 RepID=UPI001CA6D6B2|nr:OB-fold domain-containing protein [Nocardia coffeae]MBY8862337.1 OB-fold domain-containing protein [Nocardia coffeae]
MTRPTQAADPPPPLRDLNASEHTVVVDPATGPFLQGGVCTNCALAFFPTRSVCPNCLATKIDNHRFGPVGRLYSWTTVHVSSTRQVPYTVGYIDLPGDVRVLTTLGGELTALEPDCPVALAVDAAGGWTFQPILEEDAQ